CDPECLLRRNKKPGARPGWGGVGDQRPSVGQRKPAPLERRPALRLQLGAEADVLRQRQAERLGGGSDARVALPPDAAAVTRRARRADVGVGPRGRRARGTCGGSGLLAGLGHLSALLSRWSLLRCNNGEKDAPESVATPACGEPFRPNAKAT